MSESPTHPDAPRAGGETPPLDVEACVRLLESLASEGEDLYADAGAAALLSTVAAALRGIEKDRADAARWRFWRPRYLAADFDYGDPPVPVVVFRLPARFAVGADPDLTTDVLIDAARSVKPDVDVMQAEIAIYFSEVERLRASLLARHRDGERDTARLDWLEHCNSQVRGDVPILPPSCGYSVRQYIDRQLADASTPCAAPPSPERAPHD